MLYSAYLFHRRNLSSICYVTFFCFKTSFSHSLSKNVGGNNKKCLFYLFFLFQREHLRRTQLRQDAPVDDTAMVDEVFEFLKEQKDGGGGGQLEGQAPAAFR